MPEASISKILRDWRKAHSVKQESLAAMLGVTQSAISAWETGRDIPGRRLAGRILDIMSPSAAERFQLDRLAMASQGAVRASFDLDGVKLVMASRGLTAAWPGFSRSQDVRLIERLVDEASHFLHDESFMRSVRRGEVALITAVSDRHVRMDVDDSFRHRWIAVFRSYGQRMLVDMTYEACDPAAARGVESVTHYDAIQA